MRDLNLKYVLLFQSHQDCWALISEDESQYSKIFNLGNIRRDESKLDNFWIKSTNSFHKLTSRKQKTIVPLTNLNLWPSLCSLGAIASPSS